MIDAFQADDYETIAHLAEDLDRSCGPQVEFEERYLFPEVEEKWGEAYAVKLYKEHGEVIGTLMELQQLNLQSPPSSELKERWLARLRQGSEQVTTWNTLLNQLSTVSPEQKLQLLNRLQTLRKRGHRWSQLHPSSAES